MPLLYVKHCSKHCVCISSVTGQLCEAGTVHTHSLQMQSHEHRKAKRKLASLWGPIALSRRQDLNPGPLAGEFRLFYTMLHSSHKYKSLEI